jgi:carbohydrate-selective porin OprB
VTRQLVTAGLAVLNPLTVTGELALGLVWMQPIRDIFPRRGQREQTGVDVYWRMLVTPNLWLTPGLQVISSPPFNPGASTITIPDIKFRLSF